MEWDYGGCEGMTEEQIQEIPPGWNLGSRSLTAEARKLLAWGESQ